VKAALGKKGEVDRERARENPEGVVPSNRPTPGVGRLQTTTHSVLAACRVHSPEFTVRDFIFS
jgi:hypothetical protein